MIERQLELEKLAKEKLSQVEELSTQIIKQAEDKKERIFNECETVEKALTDKYIKAEEEIKSRGLTLHSWRHFLNTELQRQGLTIQQVQSVTGHKSERMTEWYNHLDPMNIPHVTKAQAAIFALEGEDFKPSSKCSILTFASVRKPESTARKHA
jgi:integrase